MPTTLERGVTTMAASRHYGRGTVVLGWVLLVGTAIYLVQVAGVVRHTLEVLRNPLPTMGPTGGYQFDLRTMAIHDFFFTAQAFGFAHLWLLWVLAVRLTRPIERRRAVVRILVLAFVIGLSVTWAMAIWLNSHGTSV